MALLPTFKFRDTAGRVNVRYEILERGPVSIRVYDALGRPVRILTGTENSEPATYTIEWEGRDEEGDPLPPGVYFIRFETHSSKLTRKLTLMK